MIIDYTNNEVDLILGSYTQQIIDADDELNRLGQRVSSVQRSRDFSVAARAALLRGQCDAEVNGTAEEEEIPRVLTNDERFARIYSENNKRRREIAELSERVGMMECSPPADAIPGPCPGEDSRTDGRTYAETYGPPSAVAAIRAEVQKILDKPGIHVSDIFELKDFINSLPPSEGAGEG